MKRKFQYIIAAVVLIIGITVWPTVYRYERISGGDRTLPVRINRITGYTEMFNGRKWIGEAKEESESELKTVPIFESLSATEIDCLKIDYDFYFPKGEQGQAYIRYSLYNRSSYKITDLFFTVDLKDEKGILVWSRIYRDYLGDSRAIYPLKQSGVLYLSICWIPKKSKITLQIDKARGRKWL